MTLIKQTIYTDYMKIRIFGISMHLHFNAFYRWWAKHVLSIRMRRKLRLIKRHKKIRVGFLVSESSKWSYQSVYDQFAADPKFEPVILITKLYLEHSQKQSFLKTMNDCAYFFINKKMNVEIAYDEANRAYIPLDKFDIDIVFYQQPWELDILQHPITVSKYAITAYSAYGFDLIAWAGPYFEWFHRWLDVYFTTSKSTLNYIQSIAKSVANCKIVGAPKLDDYFDVKEIKQNKPVIIYAPHHSFEKDSLELATMQFNGKEILEFADMTRDKFNWVFKPHPRLLHSIIQNKIMTEKQANEYYNQWRSIGRIHDTGDYIGLFKNSSALITDCCAFLAEYLPSGSPVLHLVSPKAKFNDTANDFIYSYYSIHNSDELHHAFARVLIENQDYKKEERLEKIPLVFDSQEKTASKILKIIKNIVTQR